MLKKSRGHVVKWLMVIEASAERTVRDVVCILVLVIQTIAFCVRSLGEDIELRVEAGPFIRELLLALGVLGR